MSDSEVNGNVCNSLDVQPVANSTEDLSDYTDADESISAPTEILAEFLSSIMMKDYKTALRYCTIILTYEPNNSTAKEFYPLIVEKLEMMQNEGCGDSTSESSDSNSITSLSSTNSFFDEENKSPDATSGSYSSLIDDDFCTDTKNLQITDLDSHNGNPPPAKASNSPKKCHEEKERHESTKPKAQPPSTASEVLIRSTPTRTITPGLDNTKIKTLTELQRPPTATHRLIPSPTITFPPSVKPLVAKYLPAPPVNKIPIINNNHNQIKGKKPRISPTKKSPDGHPKAGLRSGSPPDPATMKKIQTNRLQKTSLK